jgi:hypothetical protein
MLLTAKQTKDYNLELQSQCDFYHTEGGMVKEGDPARLILLGFFWLCSYYIN